MRIHAPLLLFLGVLAARPATIEQPDPDRFDPLSGSLARPFPRLERLNPMENVRARDVAARKMASDDFQALLRQWEGSPSR